MNPPFFISTAIDYPSGKPHLGHCLEKVQADVLARYKRLQGFDVHFSMGLDEHGLKIQRYAQKAGKNPQEFVSEMSEYFRDLWEALNISNNDFIRTTEKRHTKVVQDILKKINKKGDIYKGKYKGLYCVDCESYYLPKDLEAGLCPVHHKSVEIIEEETYFFRMSKYQKQLLKYIKENKNFIIPKSRKNEILNRLKQPLQDLSISRTAVKWGIPLPFDKELNLFVWVDALINYLTTIDYSNDRFKKFWPVDVHIIGKDIVWHHAVIWSSLLLSLELPLSKIIFVHGFITVDNQKVSKSLGNVIDPFELVRKYGTDAVRYFLLREISPNEDGDFTDEKFRKRYNADLANGLGNLVARVIKLVKISNFSKRQAHGTSNFQTIVSKAKKNWQLALDEFKFNEALISIWELISFCDKYIEKERPWELINQEKIKKLEKTLQREIKSSKSQKLEIILNNLLFALTSIAKLLQPFLPQTSKKILEEGKFKIKKSELLFPRFK